MLSACVQIQSSNECFRLCFLTPLPIVHPTCFIVASPYFLFIDYIRFHKIFCSQPTPFIQSSLSLFSDFLRWVGCELKTGLLVAHQSWIHYSTTSFRSIVNVHLPSEIRSNTILPHVVTAALLISQLYLQEKKMSVSLLSFPHKF